MKKEDDVELINRILSGDDAAFEILIGRYQKSIHSLVWRNINDFHYAEEIMQDTFLKAYSKLPTLKNHNQFAGWIYAIANRLCIDWIRKQKHVIQSLEDTRLEEIEESSYVHHMIEQQETERKENYHELVQKLLDKLPESERQVITFYYLEDMSTKEIGELMEVSVNTITSRLQRARKRLQTDKDLLDQEFFRHLQLPENLKENIMNQLEQLRNMFDAYVEKVEADPASRNDILKQASSEIEEVLNGEITPEMVHLAVDDIYPYMGSIGMEKRLPLLRKYMDIAPDDEERFWAHKGLVNTLAHLRQSREAIEEQKRLYRWACQNSEKHVLRVISNLSIAGCWKAEGRIDDWIKLYNEASERLENPEVSQYTRCNFLQFGAEILRRNDRLDAALLELEKLEHANGKPGRKNYFRFWLAVRENKLLLYNAQEDWERFDQVYTELNTFREGEMKKLDAGFPVNTYELIWAVHNVGCCMVWSKKYNEAKRWLQVAVDMGNFNEYSHFMLAISIWVSEKNREKTLHYLKIAEDFYKTSSYNYLDSYYTSFLETPEFSDVKDDPEFLQVFGHKPNY
ncbi:RNA polymerase sigma factor, partial [Candidatus Poribacteria bacterium]|nr:RNA polymerase sigma factor [Candidatus Poribacteria bacterium]